MGEKAIQLYQGSDWLTYRWSVAQVFDTLDRIREVCSHAPVALGIPTGASATANMPRYELAEDELAADFYGCLIELCDDLVGEMDAVLADLFSAAHHTISQRWMGFELQIHLQACRQQAVQERQNPKPSPAVVDNIMALVMRMRDVLKHIDQ